MIIVEATKKRILRYVPERLIPKASFARYYKNYFIHVLGLDLSGELWPIKSPDKLTENESPIDLFMAKHCAAEVEEVYGLSIPTSEKIKLGIFCVICVAIIVVVFMIAMSGGENVVGGLTV